MTVKINNHEFDLIRNYIENQCGIVVSDDKKYLIETRLARLLVETGARTFGELYQKITGAGDAKLRTKIVDAMTTNETLWFRDSSPWQAFRQHVLPDYARQLSQNPSRKIRIWSAACSTGQEPYTIAMLIHDSCRSVWGTKMSVDQFEIVATDISPSALFIAMAGRYDKISMKRGLDGEWRSFKERYFKDKGRVSEISDEIKKSVTFKKFNLQDNLTPLGRFDIVLCRNVAIYFSDRFKQELFEKIANILLPGGRLLLGASESLTGYSNRFSSDVYGRTTVYRCKG